jgi:hypothetical protein
MLQDMLKHYLCQTYLLHVIKGQSQGFCHDEVDQLLEVANTNEAHLDDSSPFP